MKVKQNEIRKNLGQVAYSSVVRQIMRAQKKFEELSNENENARKGFNFSKMSEQNFIENKLHKFHLIRQLYGVREKERDLIERAQKGREIVRNCIREQQRKERSVLLSRKTTSNNASKLNSRVPSRLNPSSFVPSSRV